MTDANGTRGLGQGGQSQPAQRGNPLNGTPTGNGSAHRPLNSGNANPAQGRQSASGNLPGSSFSSGSFTNPTGTRPPSRQTASGPSLDRQTAETNPASRDRIRNQSKERRSTAPTPRRRRAGKPAQRRRLFGGLSEQPKSKSASRTRAIKARSSQARSAQSSSRPASRAFSPQTGQAKPTTRITAKAQTDSLGKSGSARSGGNKQRPNLPPASPGHIPPSRSGIRRRRRARKGPGRLLRIAAVLVIVPLGIAAISGTILNISSQTAGPADSRAAEPEAPPPAPPAASFPVPLTQEVPALKATLEGLPNIYPGLTPKVFYVDVDTGKFIDIEGREPIAAASTIKLPVLLAFFQEVDAGRIDPNQTMQIQPTQVAEESGDMQFSPPGTQFTALEVATQMIINSDNTATNMIVDLLGGPAALNNRFQLMGLEQTQLVSPLPDVEGTNTTSARDLVHAMLLISEGDELSVRSRDRALNILNRTYNDSLLVGDLEASGAIAYNKTGNISNILGDVALVDHTNGKRYAVATIVQRPANDGRAVELIRRISTLTYQEADKAIQPSVTPASNPEATGETPASAETPSANPAPTPSTAPPTTSPSPAEVNEAPDAETP